MSFRLRVLMPLVAVLLVLFSLALAVVYQVPVMKARLTDYAENRIVARAVSTAETISGAKRADWQNTLRSTLRDKGERALIVDRGGNVVARAGDKSLGPIPNEALHQAANAKRMRERISKARVVVVPLTSQGKIFGGLVFVSSGEPESALYRIFLRGSIEAAAIASVLGGGLMLLAATLLSRRVERLAYGARSIEQGNFSYRIAPDYYIDELKELAESFNAMGARLEKTFSRMEETNATLGVILDNLTEGVLATDMGGGVIFINPAARTMLGVRREERLDSVPDPWDDFDLPAAVARCAKAQECGEAQVREEETFLRVNIEHLPHFDDHRGGMLVVIQDLSEGRRLEANQQRFLANAAHELKTPITTILGSAELLLTGEEEETPEQRRRFLEHIHSEAERMRKLSETLLQLARTGFDQREPDLDTVDLESVTHRAAQRMESLAQSAAVELIIEGQAAAVRADEEWLEQVLLIVLNNSLQHSDRGSRIRLRMSGNAVEVEDEGEGISEDDLPYVFERFYRQTRTSGGFGLGLPIARELVEKMGGDISISSRKGAGTVVTIELPESGQ